MVHREEDADPLKRMCAVRRCLADLAAFGTGVFRPDVPSLLQTQSSASAKVDSLAFTITIQPQKLVCDVSAITF